nr:MAG TPA: hypothetical protein [Caudoviricetes sp.]
MFLCLTTSISKSPTVLSSLKVVSLETLAARPLLGSFILLHILLYGSDYIIYLYNFISYIASFPFRRILLIHLLYSLLHNYITIITMLSLVVTHYPYY